MVSPHARELTPVWGAVALRAAVVRLILDSLAWVGQDRALDTLEGNLGEDSLEAGSPEDSRVVVGNLVGSPVEDSLADIPAAGACIQADSPAFAGILGADNLEAFLGAVHTLEAVARLVARRIRVASRDALPAVQAHRAEGLGR